jgi:hypothetical protein
MSAEQRSDWVEAMTRAVKVDAFSLGAEKLIEIALGGRVARLRLNRLQPLPQPVERREDAREPGR